VNERFHSFIHILVHIGGDSLIQNKVDAVAAQFKAEQKNRHIIPGYIFQSHPSVLCGL
jgi:hypothetical protein